MIPHRPLPPPVITKARAEPNPRQWNIETNTGETLSCARYLRATVLKTNHSAQRLLAASLGVLVLASTSTVRYGEEGLTLGLRFLWATAATKFLPPPVDPSPSVPGKDRRDTTHAVHLATDIVSPVCLALTQRHLHGRNCTVANGLLVFVQRWQFASGSRTRRTAYVTSTVAVAEVLPQRTTLFLHHCGPLPSHSVNEYE